MWRYYNLFPACPLSCSCKALLYFLIFCNHIKCICIQYHRTFHILKQKPQGFFTGRLLPHSRACRQHICPLKRLKDLSFFRHRVIGTQDCLRQRLLDDLPVAFRGQDHDHSRSAAKSAFPGKDSRSAHSAASCSQKHFSEGSFISCGISCRKKPSYIFCLQCSRFLPACHRFPVINPYISYKKLSGILSSRIKKLSPLGKSIGNRHVCAYSTSLNFSCIGTNSGRNIQAAHQSSLFPGGVDPLYSLPVFSLQWTFQSCSKQSIHYNIIFLFFRFALYGNAHILQNPDLYAVFL